MAGRLIGEAYISLLADGSLFKADADAKVNAVIKSMRPTIQVRGDFGDVDKKVAALAATLKNLRGTATLDSRGFIKTVGEMETAVLTLMERLDDIPADINDSKMLSKLFGARGVVNDLAHRLENLDADADTDKLLAKIYGAIATVEDLETIASHIDVNGDIGKMEAKIATLVGSAKELSADLANMRADVTDSALLSKIATAQAQVLAFAKSMRNLPVTADTLPFEASLYKLMAQIEAIKKLAAKPEVAPILPYFIPGNRAKGTNPFAFGTLNTSTLNNSEAKSMDDLTMHTLNAMTAVRELNAEFKVAPTVMGAAARGIAAIAAGDSMIIKSNVGGWAGFATTKIALFGHALDNILPKWARAISVWHLGADVLFEFAAAWAPALIAVGTFAAYAFPVGEKIAGQWKNINTILDGVGGKTLPDLGSQFDTIESHIRPSILIAFGEYMQVVGKNGQALGTVLAGVGKVVDDWGAALVNWSGRATKAFNGFVHSGTGDFALIGEGFHELFRIIGDLIHDMPGIVHVLLPIGDAVLRFTANVVQALGPILSFGLLIHGVMIYAGLAVTAVVALGRAISVAAITSFASKTGGIAVAGEQAAVASGKFSKFGTAIGAFAGNVAGSGVALVRWTKETGALVGTFGMAEVASMKAGNAFARLPGVTANAGGGFTVLGRVMSGGAVAAGGLAAAIGVGVVGALVYFAVKAYNAKSAAQDLNAEMTKLIANSTTANFEQNLTLAFSKTSAAIKGNQSDLVKLTGTANVTSKTLTSMGPALANPEFGFSALGQKVIAANTNLNENRAALGQYATNLNTYGSRVGSLATVFGSTGAALSALNLIGVNAGQVATEGANAWANQYVKLVALAKGYGYMGQQAGAAGNQLDALNISTGTTYKNIQALVQAETGWVSLVTGGEAGFTAFEQGFTALSGAIGNTAKNAPTATVTLGKLREQFVALGGKMNGTSAASLAVRQAFDQQLSAGVTLFGNLQMLDGASGHTAASQGQLAKAGKDIIAQLLPFAAGSKQATAELSSLAQLMGGPATDNFQVLAKWVGNTKGAAADLNTEQAKLTISSAKLSKASQNLGNAISTDVTQMEASKIATASMSGAVDGLYKAFQSGHGAVTQAAVSLAGEYVSALHKTGMSTHDATGYLNAYLKSLGYGPAAIAAIDSQLGDSAGQWNKYNKIVTNNTATSKNMAKATNANKAAFQGLYGVLPGSTSALDKVWAATLKQDAAMVKSGKDTTGAKGQFLDFAHNGLGVTTEKANELWAKFGKQNLDWLATHAGNTKSKFMDFAVNGLKLTQLQAQTLWGEFAMQNLDMLVTKGVNAKNKFIDLAMNGLNLTKAQAGDLWNTLKMQYLDTVGNKAGETKRQFEGTAKQLGLTKAAADKLWASLKNLAAGSPYKTTTDDTISGSGGIVAKANIPGQPQLSARLNFSAAAHGLAAGGIVRGGIHGQDSVPTMLAPGELVIPSSHAPHFGDMARKAGIPGMAGGGFVNAANSQIGTIGNIIPFTDKQAAQFSAESTAAFVKAFDKQAQSALNTASAAAGGAYNGPSSFGGGFESLAALVAFARYFMSQGLNAAAAAGMAATISGEETSAGPESRNCVPLTYKVVTARGLLAHDEVKAGDKVPGYNLATGRLEVATILDVPYHYDAEMCRIGNERWSVVCTVDHKWITERGLVRADRLTYEDKVKLGDGWYEVLNSYERLPNEDTFCLTTTTGTWTVMPDNSEMPIWTGNSSGFGLIGWTGNTVGLPPGYTGPTGNVAYDLQQQLRGVIGYMNSRGGRGPLNAAGNPVAAGDVWSTYEAPKIRYSDTRPANAIAIYAALQGAGNAAASAAGNVQGKLGQTRHHSAGGMLNEPVYGVGARTGLPYSFAERRSEYVGPLSGGSGSSGHMQPMTSIQGTQTNNQLAAIAKLLQQLPTTLGKAISQGSGNGVRHGYYRAQN